MSSRRSALRPLVLPALIALALLSPAAPFTAFAQQAAAPQTQTASGYREPVAELKAIWEPAAQGKITNWKQVNPAWPDRPLKLYGPGADSGTFEYFTEAINGKAKATRGDFTASEDDNVLVQGVARDVGGLGYFGFAYYIENKDKLAAV